MKRISIISLCSLLLFFGFSIVSCKKINTATELGQELIPDVDNIHTFDTTLQVETVNKLFTAATDSFRNFYSDGQVLGIVDNDPLFGKSDARMYVQLLPYNTKYTLAGVAGKRYIDSIVLSLSYAGAFGDTTVPQTIQVSEISQAADFVYFSRRDTAANYSIWDNSWYSGAGILGTGTVIPRNLKDSTFDIRRGDTVPIANQLRIKLDNSFGQRLLDYDTSGVNDAYSTDSLFLTKLKGVALESVGGGNGLMVFALGDTSKTRVSVYYRYEKADTPGDIDTTVATFIAGGANANYISRNYTGTQIPDITADDDPDDILFIQNTPGSYANIRIPGLKDIQKGVIHLAELSMESVFDASDSMFSSPGNLFLDVYDSAAAKYKLMPYGFLYTSSGLSGFNQFFSVGSTATSYNYYTKDASGNIVKQWRFNLTPYVQNLVNGKIPLHTMRLYAPAYNQLGLGDASPITTMLFPIPVSGNVVPGIGRVRIAGGAHLTQKMKLRIVYSKP